jgi:hypothetical protein
MPVTYRLVPERGFIETACTGDVRLEEVLDHLRELGRDPAMPAQLDVLLDLDGLTSLPESAQLRNVTRAVADLGSRLELGACAVVAGGDAAFGMSRVFGVFVEELFSDARVFRKRADAEAWLASRR